MIKNHRPLHTVLLELNNLIDELADRNIYIQDDNDPDWRLSQVVYEEEKDTVWFRTEEL